MPWKGNDYQPDLSEAVSNLTYDKYGQEHDEDMESLLAVVDGTRKHYADKLRALAAAQDADDAVERADVIRWVAALLDPYSTELLARPEEFARSNLVGEDGAKQIKP